MTKKLLTIILSCFSILLIVQSCDSGYCKDVDFYDFSQVQIYIKKSTSIETNDSLNFEIPQLDTRYMAQNHPKLELINTVYALNCDYGWNGMKIPLTKIEITSNADFNEDHPKNTLLNDLIIAKVVIDDESYNREYEFKMFDKVRFERILPREYTLNPDFYIVEKPSLEQTHQLTIKIFKSNGDIITAKSEEIFWE